MFVCMLQMRRGHPWCLQGAEPLPLSVIPMPSERNTVSGFMYAPLWFTESVLVSSGTLLPLTNLGFWGF